MEKIHGINKTIAEYFEKNENENECRPKDLMPLLMKNGVFDRDHRDGLPLRKILRELNAKNKLHLIPSLFADQKAKNVSWYFLRSGLEKGKS